MNFNKLQNMPSSIQESELKNNNIFRLLSPDLKKGVSEIRFVKEFDSNINIVYEYLVKKNNKNEDYSICLKKYLSHWKKSPQFKIPFSNPPRGKVEQYFLKLLANVLSPLTNIVIPEPLQYISDLDILIMKKIQFDTNESDWSTSMKSGWVGDVLGRTLSLIQNSTVDRNIGLNRPKFAHDLFRVRFEESISRHSHKEQLRKILDTYKINAKQLPSGVVLGSLWHGNVMICPNSKIGLFDFEFANIDNVISDIGFFLGHLFVKCVEKRDKSNLLKRCAKLFWNSYTNGLDPRLKSFLPLMESILPMYMGLVCIYRSNNYGLNSLKTNFANRLGRIGYEIMLSDMEHPMDLFTQFQLDPVKEASII